MAEDGPTSEFNMAVSYLNRLNSLLAYANVSSIETDGHGWYHALMALFRELSPHLKKEEYDIWTANMINLNRQVSMGLKRQNSGETGINGQLYMDLHKFHIFLMGVLQRSGLLNRMMEDAAQALK